MATKNVLVSLDTTTYEVVKSKAEEEDRSLSRWIAVHLRSFLAEEIQKENSKLNKSLLRRKGRLYAGNVQVLCSLQDGLTKRN